MRRVHLWAMAAAAPIVGLALVVSLGCGGKSEVASETKEVKKETGKSGGSKEKTAVEGNYSGTLKGKVTFKGKAPDLDAATKELVAQMEKGDKAHCVDSATAAEKSQQKWIISKDNGLANVVVWIKPAEKNQYFKIDKSKKTWPDKVILDQPHCAFTPHVLVAFPQFWNPETKKTEKTGQAFIVKNSAEINHNTNTGDDNQIIPAKGEKEFAIGKINELTPIKCNIHGWMTGYLWAFDHPFAAVTKEDGTFEIKGVPVGATVRFLAWHEEKGYVPDNKGVELKLEETTTKNIDVEP